MAAVGGTYHARATMFPTKTPNQTRRLEANTRERCFLNRPGRASSEARTKSSGQGSQALATRRSFFRMLIGSTSRPRDCGRRRRHLPRSGNYISHENTQPNSTSRSQYSRTGFLNRPGRASSEARKKSSGQGAGAPGVPGEVPRRARRPARGNMLEKIPTAGKIASKTRRDYVRGVGTPERGARRARRPARGRAARKTDPRRKIAVSGEIPAGCRPVRGGTGTGPA